MKPVVGVTASVDTDRRFRREALYLYRGYADAAAAVGLVPVVLPVPRGAPGGTAIADLLETLDGVVLSGGADIDPAGERIAYEAALLRGALDRRIPVLGICLGVQTMNVAFGGTLHQHIPDAFPDSGLAHDTDDGGRHAIRVEKGSLLSGILGGAGEATVNSYHHQAVNEIGQGLVVTARAPDGVPEAIELAEPRGTFCLGVQWHPERALDEPASRAVLEAFAAACSGRRAQRA